MVQHGHFSPGINPDAQPLAGGAAMAHRAEHLVAPQHQLNRSPGHAGGKDRQHRGAVRDRLGPEAAAQIGAADQNILWRDAEVIAIGPARHHDGLIGHVECDVIALPLGNHCVGFHRVVVLLGRLIGQIDRLHRRRVTCGHIAIDGLARTAKAANLHLVGRVAVEADACGQSLVLRVEQARAFGCGLQRFAQDQRDGLVGVAHRIVLQRLEPEGEHEAFRFRVAVQHGAVCGCNHLGHPGVRLGSGNVEVADAAPRYGGRDIDRIKQPVGMIISRKGSGSGHLGDAVAARKGLPGV
ncbi:hypothetical protein GALL_512060 [mine drainage metagenome]|uniref:Uncharacterized protein n=1 Tax=mine drainage metagenome TaxID=410659 RepID=A0A1J5P7N1_9ZZZZ